MTYDEHTHNKDESIPSVDETVNERDLLVQRIVDDEATDADWEAFRDLATTDSMIWRHVAEEQHLARRLREEFESTVAAAMCVELPFATGETTLLASHHPADHTENNQVALQPYWSQFGSYTRAVSGWAAAIAVAALWFASTLITGSNQPSDHATTTTNPKTPNGTSVVTHNSTDTNAPLDNKNVNLASSTFGVESPYVVKELQPILIDTTQTEDGQQVTYLRRIIEQRNIEGLYNITLDENGLPIIRDTAPVTTMTDYSGIH